LKLMQGFCHWILNRWTVHHHGPLNPTDSYILTGLSWLGDAGPWSWSSAWSRLAAYATVYA